MTVELKPVCDVCGEALDAIRDPRCPNVCDRCFSAAMRLREWKEQTA